MRTKVYIVGNGIYAQMLLEYLLSDSNVKTTYIIEGFVVDKNYIKESVIKGFPVVSFDYLETVSKGDVKLILGIGYSHMGDIRKEIYYRCKNLGFEFLNYIHPTAIIHPNARIGEGNIFLENIVVESGCLIGDGNLFYAGTILGHDSEIGNYNTLSVGAMTAGCVKISDNCFLGVRAAVKDHVIIDDHVLIGATAYAYKDVTSYNVVYSPRCEISATKKSTELL